MPLLRLVFFFIAAPPLFFVLVLFLAIDNTPITESTWVLTNKDFERAKNIVANPTVKTQNSIFLNQKDLNITLSYLLNNYIPSTSQITVANQLLSFKISLLLNHNTIGKYLNISFKLTKQHGYPVIHSFQVGKITIADEFAGLILENAIKHSPLKDYYILVAQHVKNIQISAKGLNISYITSPELVLKNEFSLNKNYYQSIAFYQQQITNIVANHDPKWRLSLTDLSQPLFKAAYNRSTRKTAQVENRALLIAVSTYVNKNEIQAFLPFDIGPATNHQYPASLYKRADMAKHFMASAVLAASGSEALANILGQEKELKDAKHGSGFSFIDLAGDRAGLRFGKRAIRTKSKARRLQLNMSKIKSYKAFMPDVRDLPENLSEQDFKRDYQSIYSITYKEMLEKIDQRIDALLIYQ